MNCYVVFFCTGAWDRVQFEIIDLLYLRLGYSVLLEWGNTIDKMIFDKWIGESSNYENQPQEKKVEWTTLTISNIKEISLNGTKYIVE